MYVLCGFGSIGGMGIQLGALGAMAPSRRKDFAQLVVRSLIAGNVACHLTACIAGRPTFRLLLFLDGVCLRVRTTNTLAIELIAFNPSSAVVSVEP